MPKFPKVVYIGWMQNDDIEDGEPYLWTWTSKEDVPPFVEVVMEYHAGETFRAVHTTTLVPVQ